MHEHGDDSPSVSSPSPDTEQHSSWFPKYDVSDRVIKLEQWFGITPVLAMKDGGLLCTALVDSVALLLCLDMKWEGWALQEGGRGLPPAPEPETCIGE